MDIGLSRPLPMNIEPWIMCPKEATLHQSLLNSDSAGTQCAGITKLGVELVLEKPGIPRLGCGLLFRLELHTQPAGHRLSDLIVLTGVEDTKQKVNIVRW